MRRLRFGLLSVAAFTVALSMAVTAAAFHAASSAAASPWLAVRGDRGVFLMTTTGVDRRPVHAEAGKGAGSYVWYSWSPEGRYLLLVKVEAGSGLWDLLLADRDGHLLRRLGSRLPPSSTFYPSWSVDGDRVAYLAATRGAQVNVHNRVESVDVRGHKTFLFSFESSGGGCGGGGGDPAQLQYWAQTGNGGMTWALQWSGRRGLAAGNGMLFDLHTGSMRRLGQGPSALTEPALSRSGALAATVRTCGHVECDSTVVLVNPRTGAVARNIAPGEMPAWSPDGRFIFFVQRRPGKTLTMKDPNGNTISAPTYTTELWRADAAGSHLTRLTSEDAYGVGFLQVSRNGRSLIYSRVDNDWNLWRHRLGDGRYTTVSLQRYGPKVRVERLDIGGRPVTVADGVGVPALQG